ncbi:glycerol kinase [Entomomonas moraniae]|uniref:Glycerol kinase n=1 Tax=Entomomonas moraniae TaxID=2213226 RepID=A0A3S9XC39_9GAMM|nr:glycerol kinase GlpK [Entomomonas moraniae]AZS49956.1 glycerol kinase [Entomomonas moraniae]
MVSYILSIDQGTTSTRVIIFDPLGHPITTAQKTMEQSFPKDGWVEHDPHEIWSTTLALCQQALKQAHLKGESIIGIGITNQRETTIVWDKLTGKAIYPAIVWQDRRTADYCQSLKEAGYEQQVLSKTGLLIDPYFSATKLRWILDNVPNARTKACKGELLFGTVDSFLLWNLTGGQSHYTDATNAARTMLFNIHEQSWDNDLLALFDIPEALLPTVLDCAAEFGHTQNGMFDCQIPILGIAGDQQSALIGQACFNEGMVKSTYGTGCFMIKNTGTEPVISKNRLLTTIAYRLQGKTTYALEGSIFVAGATVQWLRDGLKLFANTSDAELIAESTPDTRGVYLVPAFTGLGAPYWDPKARGAIFGLTRDTGIQEIVTAGLESVCYQTCDLLLAMQEDSASPLTTLRVDGGMAINNWLMQFLADILNITVERPVTNETTALGVAWLVTLQANIYQSLDEIASHWSLQRCFTPVIAEDKRQQLYNGWLKAVERVCLTQ